MTDTSPKFRWREPNTPLAELAPGEIAYAEPPAGQEGMFVNLRGFDGMGKGPLRWNTAPNADGQLFLTSGRP